MCVQKVAGASLDRWGHGAPAGQRGAPGRGDSVSVFVLSQDQSLVDAGAGHHPRVGAAQEEEGWRRRAL